MSTPPNITVLDNAELFHLVRHYLDEGQPVMIPTNGHSMLPLIRGCRDRVRLVPAGPLVRWQIVLACLPDDRFVLHRMVRVEPSRIVLMGDGNLWNTEVCAPSDVWGVAQAVIRPDGRETDCMGPGALCFGAVWFRLRFLRRIFLAIYRRCFLKNI